MIRARFRPVARQSLALPLLVALFVVLWIAGGASRPDAAGQAIVRFAAGVLLMIAALWGPRPVFANLQVVSTLLGACALLVALQLVPLPPSIWQSLPGRGELVVPIAEARIAWRPFAVVPDGGLNALLSLIVPFAVLLIAASGTAGTRARLAPVLLVLVLLSMLLGLLQFSGAQFNHPLVNETVGSVSGSFANRNHFALFLAIGCLLVPMWAFADGRQASWRAIAGPVLLVLLLLTILATGSRTGVILGLIAVICGVALAWRGIRAEAGRHPRKVSAALMALIALICIGIIISSFEAGRAISIDRALEAGLSEDMRTRGIPIVLQLVKDFFPWGAGFGGFDPLFRKAEPFDLLKPTYFNHAHNDFLEVLLDGGVFGAGLIAVAILWWLRSSILVWRSRADVGLVIPRLGSAILLLIIIASVVDYPVRTPMFMAVTVVAALWLADGRRARAQEPALPGNDDSL